VRRFALASFVVVAVATAALARDITTLKGETFYNVTITRVEKTGIGVTHRDGVVFLDFLMLPEDIRKEFGYSPEAYDAGQVALQQQQAAALEFQKRLATEAAVREAEQRANALTIESSNSSISTRDYTMSDYSSRNYSGHRYTGRTYSGGTVSVRGYFRKDGTYVRPHTRSAPSRHK
jgi:hypothetical protein